MENKTRNNIIRALHKKMGEAHELLDQIDNCDVDGCDEPGYAWCEAHPDRRICSYHATPDEEHECYFCPECYAEFLADQSGETKQCSCDTTRGEGDCPKPDAADLIPREEHERAVEEARKLDANTALKYLVNEYDLDTGHMDSAKPRTYPFDHNGHIYEVVVRRKEAAAPQPTAVAPKGVVSCIDDNLAGIMAFVEGAYYESAKKMESELRAALSRMEGEV